MNLRILWKDSVKQFISHRRNVDTDTYTRLITVNLIVTNFPSMYVFKNLNPHKYGFVDWIPFTKDQ